MSNVTEKWRQTRKNDSRASSLLFTFGNLFFFCVIKSCIITSADNITEALNKKLQIVPLPSEYRKTWQGYEMSAITFKVIAERIHVEIALLTMKCNEIHYRILGRMNFITGFLFITSSIIIAIYRCSKTHGHIPALARKRPPHFPLHTKINPLDEYAFLLLRPNSFFSHVGHCAFTRYHVTDGEQQQ